MVGKVSGGCVCPEKHHPAKVGSKQGSVISSRFLCSGRWIDYVLSGLLGVASPNIGYRLMLELRHLCAYSR